MAAHGPRTVAAILVAGGSGTRLGADVPKAFVCVAGRTLLEHAVERFAAHAAVRDVVVVAPAALLARAGELIPAATVVAGGATRQASVRCGLAALAADVELVLVHDAARAFVPVAVISRVVDALNEGAEAVVPTLPIADTVRSLDAAGGLGGTVDRRQLVAVQTPQGFVRALLDRAHTQAGSDDASDDASLVEAIGGTVSAVAGDDAAFKITRPLDLALAELVAARGPR